MTVTGRLAADAVVKTTTNGTQYLEFRMANNERSISGKKGEMDTCWFRVYSFNHVNMQQYLIKGKPIEVVGDLYVRPYISTVNNAPEVGLDIKANAIMFDNNFGNGGNGNSQQVEAPATPVAPAPVAPAPDKKTTKATRNPSTTSVPQAAPSGTDDTTDDLPF